MNLKFVTVKQITSQTAKQIKQGVNKLIKLYGEVVSLYEWY